MKKKPFNPLILGAFVLGLVGFWLVISQFKKMDAENKQAQKDIEARLRSEFEKSKPGQVMVVNEVKKRPVVYAKTPIKPGDRIEVTMLETKETPEELMLSAYTKPDEVIGQYATTEIEIGQPLMPTNVSKQVQRISVKLTPGMRAISLPISGAFNVTGGFVTDGDLVDVVLTYKVGGRLPNGEMPTRTMIVLQSVKILYAPGPDDYRTDQTRPVKSRPVGDIVTLEVTPDQAEMLAQFSQMGDFRLILRNREDTIQWRTKGYSATEFIDDENAAQRRANRSVQNAAEVMKVLNQAAAEQPGGANP